MIKNYKTTLAISIILLSSALSASCMMMGGGMDMGNKSKGGMDMDNYKQAPKTKKSSSKCGDDMDISNKIDKSYVIAKRYCTQCHIMRESDEFSKSKWKPILKRMMGYMQNQAKLQPDEYETIMIKHYYAIE